MSLKILCLEFLFSIRVFKETHIKGQNCCCDSGYGRATENCACDRVVVAMCLRNCISFSRHGMQDIVHNLSVK